MARGMASDDPCAGVRDAEGASSEEIGFLRAWAEVPSPGSYDCGCGTGAGREGGKRL